MLITLLWVVLIGSLFVGFLILAFKMAQPGYRHSDYFLRQNGKPNFSIFSHNDSWIGPTGREIYDSTEPDEEELVNLDVKDIDFIRAKDAQRKPRCRR